MMRRWLWLIVLGLVFGIGLAVGLFWSEASAHVQEQNAYWRGFFDNPIGKAAWRGQCRCDGRS